MAADFNTPVGAVNAFLNAAKAKDRAKIAQATARRAPTEAVAKNREFFAVLLNESVGDDQLDQLATAFDGYTVSGLQRAINTGQMGVNLSKSSGGDALTRTVQVRREKDGWKVLDWQRGVYVPRLWDTEQQAKRYASRRNRAHRAPTAPRFRIGAGGEFVQVSA